MALGRKKTQARVVRQSQLFLGGIAMDATSVQDPLPPAFADMVEMAAELLQAYATHAIRNDELAELLKRLRVRDSEGGEWTIGASSMAWYRRTPGLPWSRSNAPGKHVVAVSAVPDLVAEARILQQVRALAEEKERANDGRFPSRAHAAIATPYAPTGAMRSDAPIVIDGVALDHVAPPTGVPMPPVFKPGPLDGIDDLDDMEQLADGLMGGFASRDDLLRMPDTRDPLFGQVLDGGSVDAPATPSASGPMADLSRQPVMSGAGVELDAFGRPVHPGDSNASAQAPTPTPAPSRPREDDPDFSEVDGVADDELFNRLLGPDAW